MLARGRVLSPPLLAAAATLLAAVSTALAARSADAGHDHRHRPRLRVQAVRQDRAAGKVTFVVTNTGKEDHSFQIAGKKTPVMKPGKSAKLVVTFTKAGPVRLHLDRRRRRGKGMKGTLTVKAAVAPAPRRTYGRARTVFVATGCGACHTLKAAGSTGTTGPNLDRSTVRAGEDPRTITDGKGDDAGVRRQADVPADPGRGRVRVPSAPASCSSQTRC